MLWLGFSRVPGLNIELLRPCFHIFCDLASCIRPRKFNSSPLKNGGWKTTFLLGFGNFSGAMLNFGRVDHESHFCHSFM